MKVQLTHFFALIMIPISFICLSFLGCTTATKLDSKKKPEDQVSTWQCETLATTYSDKQGYRRCVKYKIRFVVRVYCSSKETGRVVKSPAPLNTMFLWKFGENGGSALVNQNGRLVVNTTSSFKKEDQKLWLSRANKTWEIPFPGPYEVVLTNDQCI